MSDREYPTRPIVGVGAVVFDRGNVVLIRRAREPLKGQWSLPGGAVELGERLDDAIAREVREETGLDVDVGPVVEVLDRVRLGEDRRIQFHYVLVDFLCRPVPGTGREALVPGTDAEAAHWVGVESLAEYAVAEPTVRVIRKAVERAASGWTPGPGYARLD
jgi:mutator protein MutT